MSNETQNYLLKTLQSGRELRQRFQDEWTEDSKRFLKPVKRVHVQNFAAGHTEKAKKFKVTASQSSKSSAENLRDMFARMVIVVAKKTSFDLLFCPVFLYLLTFFRKGETKPLDLVIKDDSGNYLNLFTSIRDGRI